MATAIAANDAPLDKLDTAIAKAGAAPDSWFQHIALEVPGTEPRNEWLEPLDDAAYAKATGTPAP